MPLLEVVSYRVLHEKGIKEGAIGGGITFPCPQQRRAGSARWGPISEASQQSFGE